ncbi:major capsid protein [Sphaerimonospora mesophila]|uniref:major capsid protein n=1 Tax=Sphaerimonospora mesophila TaxID=37483 RepID=UPI00128F7CD9
MDAFELPEDITSLPDDELAALLDGAVQAFDARSNSSTVTPDDLEQLRTLATAVNDIRAEQQARREAAEQAAAEIDALAAQVRGTTPDDDDEAEDGEGEGEVEAAATPDPEPEPREVAATAVIAPRRPVLDLSGVRRRQPRVLPPDPNPRPEITASVDVPGYQPGQALDMDGVTEGIIRRANALKTAGGGVGLTASYRLPFDKSLIINDSSSGTEGTRAVILAADQSRLSGGDIVASGGWCAPSETVYDLAQVACPEMLWDAPEIQLARGGLRYFPIPSLDVASMTFVHTEADDIAGTEKPCFKIPCPEPVEVRCDAVGVCLESGILTQRHFPELVAWYQKAVMVAHELRIRQHLFEQAVAQATPVALPETFGALSAIYAAIALQAADMVERHSLCDSINIEVVLPWWSRSLMLADLARQNGRSLSEVRVQDLVNLFATLGVGIQWARGLGPAVPDEIGGPTPATVWPAEIQMLMYVAGSLQIGRGGEISLGVIHSQEKFKTNDYTAIFSEECVALINRGPDLRLITLPICPSGATGAQTELTCPIP